MSFGTQSPQNQDKVKAAIDAMTKGGFSHNPFVGGQQNLQQWGAAPVQMPQTALQQPNTAALGQGMQTFAQMIASRGGQQKKKDEKDEQNPNAVLVTLPNAPAPTPQGSTPSTYTPSSFLDPNSADVDKQGLKGVLSRQASEARAQKSPDGKDPLGGPVPLDLSQATNKMSTVMPGEVANREIGEAGTDVFGVPNKITGQQMTADNWTDFAQQSHADLQKAQQHLYELSMSPLPPFTPDEHHTTTGSKIGAGLAVLLGAALGSKSAIGSGLLQGLANTKAGIDAHNAERFQQQKDEYASKLAQRQQEISAAKDAVTARNAEFNHTISMGNVFAKIKRDDTLAEQADTKIADARHRFTENMALRWYGAKGMENQREAQRVHWGQELDEQHARDLNTFHVGMLNAQTRVSALNHLDRFQAVGLALRQYQLTSAVNKNSPQGQLISSIQTQYKAAEANLQNNVNDIQKLQIPEREKQKRIAEALVAAQGPMQAIIDQAAGIGIDTTGMAAAGQVELASMAAGIPDSVYLDSEGNHVSEPSLAAKAPTAATPAAGAPAATPAPGTPTQTPGGGTGTAGWTPEDFRRYLDGKDPGSTKNNSTATPPKGGASKPPSDTNSVPPSPIAGLELGGQNQGGFSSIAGSHFGAPSTGTQAPGGPPPAPHSPYKVDSSTYRVTKPDGTTIVAPPIVRTSFGMVQQFVNETDENKRKLVESIPTDTAKGKATKAFYQSLLPK